MPKAPAYTARHSAQPTKVTTRSRVRWSAVAVVILALLVGSGTIALLSRTKALPAAASTATPRAIHLSVVSMSPASGATAVAPSSDITVSFSAPLASDSPLPTLNPPEQGSWQPVSPSELEFVTAGPLVPGSQESVSVPGGRHGLLGLKGERLRHTYHSTFSVAQASMLRLQELLGQLGYLPLTFTPASEQVSPQDLADDQAGTFAWRWPNQPATLTGLWTQGMYNVITKGAVMSFESQHNLTADGIAGPKVWSALLSAASTGSADPLPYGYVYVQKTLPETVTVYQSGASVYSTLANTGVAGAATPDGTFPVYERFLVTTMKGTNPNGTKYVDPGIPWVSYFTGNDALHGFVRASYGFPQSDGCVEMPPAHAAIVFPDTPIGTLVTVQ
jgi:peptidoglycan hydrolase-like protein with peptidoglycan-binding domain